MDSENSLAVCTIKRTKKKGVERCRIKSKLTK